MKKYFSWNTFYYEGGQLRGKINLIKKLLKWEIITGNEDELIKELKSIQRKLAILSLARNEGRVN